MKAGFAHLEITPQFPVELAGYGFYLKRVFTKVHDPLFTRVLALELDDTRILIISCDIIGFDITTIDKLKKQISKKCNVVPDNILIHATHTHTGPATAYMRACGFMNDEYCSWMQTRIVETAISACSDMIEVESVKWSETDCLGIAFSRVLYDGPLDTTLRTLVINRKDSRPLALVNFGCHPVSNGHGWEVSADYPGQIVSCLTESGYDCMFITGFCGDIDPLREPRNYETSEKYGKQMADIVLKSIDDDAELIDCSHISSIIMDVELKTYLPDKAYILDNLSASILRMEKDPNDIRALYYISWLNDMLKEVEKNELNKYIKAHLQAVRIGNVVLAAFPGETYTQFGLNLRNKYPDFKIMTVNCGNESIGYITTANDFDHEGYASTLAPGIYGVYSFVKGFGEILCKQAEKLLSMI